MVQVRCRVCLLEASLREEVHALLRGSTDPPRPALSSPKVSAWLETTHGILVRYPAINEHVRRHLTPAAASVPAGSTDPSAQAPPKAKAKKTPPSDPAVGEPTEGGVAPNPPASPPAAPPPPGKHPVVQFIDDLCENTARTVFDMNATLRRRTTEIVGDVTETPGQEKRQGSGSRRDHPSGPTDESRYVPAALASIAALLKVRPLYLGGGFGKAGDADAASQAQGLKAAMAALGLPPPPPLMEGDDTDPLNDDATRGYEAASPEPPPQREEDEGGRGKAAPPPPPSGPRTPATAPQPTPLKVVGGGGWGTSWKASPPTTPLK